MQVRLEMAPNAPSRVAMLTSPFIDKGDGVVHRLMAIAVFL
jgi:hypothetical protein